MTPHRRKPLRQLALAVALTSVMLGSNALANAPSAQESHPGYTRVGRAPAHKQVQFSLALRFPGRDALDRYIAEQHVSATPNWLSATEIGERFGLPDDRIEAAVRALERAGVHVVKSFEQRTTLLVEGRASAVERLFSLQLEEYAAPDGARFRAPSRAPRIPRALAGVITGVTGLDTRPVWEHHHAVGQVPKGSGLQKGGLGPLEPDELRRAYGADELHDDGVDGEGETVAVVSLASLRGEELELWERLLDQPVGDVEHVVVPPAPPGPDEPRWSAGGSQEVALDIQMIRALAPSATVLNYMTRNGSDALVRAVNAIVEDGRTNIISISWGLCESYLLDVFQNEDLAYAVAEASGINIFVASGDDGAHGCYRNQVPPDLQVSVDWPSASSHTISVGGTTLFHERSGKYVREEAWVLPNGIGGAGGGVSIVIPKPPWQVGPGVENASSTGFRQVPDVAGPSDPSSNLIVVVWDPDSDDYIPALAGGTSAAAPFWAGVTALLQQHVGGTVGDLSPVLYGFANSRDYAVAFFDVSSGANDVYVASAGWDYITGLGSPRVDGLAELLSAP